MYVCVNHTVNYPSPPFPHRTHPCSQSLSTLSYVEKLLAQHFIPIPHSTSPGGAIQYSTQKWTKGKNYCRKSGGNNRMALHTSTHHTSIHAPYLHSSHLHSPHLHSPHLHSPHLNSPHLPSPHLHSPHLHSPHLHSPHLHSPHLNSPQLHSPHLPSPHLHSPHLHSPHLNSPYLHSPHLHSPHLHSPHLLAVHIQHLCCIPPRSGWEHGQYGTGSSDQLLQLSR